VVLEGGGGFTGSSRPRPGRRRVCLAALAPERIPDAAAGAGRYRKHRETMSALKAIAVAPLLLSLQVAIAFAFGPAKLPTWLAADEGPPLFPTVRPAVRGDIQPLAKARTRRVAGGRRKSHCRFADVATLWATATQRYRSRCGPHKAAPAGDCPLQGAAE